MEADAWHSTRAPGSGIYHAAFSGGNNLKPLHIYSIHFAVLAEIFEKSGTLKVNMEQNAFTQISASHTSKTIKRGLRGTVRYLLVG